MSNEKIGDVLKAKGKLQDALDSYQRSFAIAKHLADQDKSNADWQRDLIVLLYKIGSVAAKVGGNDRATQAQGFLQSGLTLAELYPGPDRQDLIDRLDQALKNLVQ